MLTLHKVSLLRNSTPILLLSKTNTNLKFRASARLAWNCMKMRLFHNLEVLRYKMMKTCRRTQQQWSSWKSTREGRMNLEIFLKNFRIYFYSKSSVCKICTLQSKKNRRKKVKLCTYSRFITPAPLYTCARFWTDPIPSNCKRTLWMAPYRNKIDQSNGNNNFLWKKKTCTLLLLASVSTDADILTKLVSIYKEEILLYSILAIQQINFECKETLK